MRAHLAVLAAAWLAGCAQLVIVPLQPSPSRAEADWTVAAR
jgi:hypothetical protein